MFPTSTMAPNNTGGTSTGSVPKLRFQDPVSYLKTYDALVLYLAAQFGQEYDFLAKGKYRKIPDPDVKVYASLNLSNEDLSKVKLDAVKRHVAEAKIRTMNRGRICGFILQLLSPEGIQAVKSDRGYDEADEDNDPLKLWKVVMKTHITEPVRSGGNKDFQRNEAYKRLAALRMKKGETLLEYRQVYDLYSDTFCALGGTRPPEADRAISFMQGASTYYSQYITMLQNSKLVGGNAIAMPKTIDEAFDAMRQFRLEDSHEDGPRHGSNQRVQMAANSRGPTSDGEESESHDSDSDTSTPPPRATQRKKKACKRCGQPGHKAELCRAPAPVPGANGKTHVEESDHASEPTLPSAPKQGSRRQRSARRRQGDVIAPVIGVGTQRPDDYAFDIFSFRPDQGSASGPQQRAATQQGPESRPPNGARQRRRGRGRKPEGYTGALRAPDPSARNPDVDPLGPDPWRRDEEVSDTSSWEGSLSLSMTRACVGLPDATAEPERSAPHEEVCTPLAAGEFPASSSQFPTDRG